MMHPPGEMIEGAPEADQTPIASESSQLAKMAESVSNGLTAEQLQKRQEALAKWQEKIAALGTRKKEFHEKHQTKREKLATRSPEEQAESLRRNEEIVARLIVERKQRRNKSA